MSAKRIGVVLPNPNLGIYYQRVHLPFRQLDRDKWDLRFFDFDSIKHQDGFYMDGFIVAHPSHAEYFSVVNQLQAFYRKPIITDIDDLLTDLQVDHPDREYFGHCKHLVPKILQMSAHVVTSTDWLKAHYAHLNKNISVIPNAIDVEIFKGYEPKPKPYKTCFTVGWCGGQSHRADQYQFLPGLCRFMDEFEDVRASFKILVPQQMLDRYGSRVFYDETVSYFLDWPAYVATAPWDVVVTGLYPHPFNEGKSDLRLLDCGAHGIPIIASPRSDFKKHIEAGRCLEAKDSADGMGWYEALKHAYQNQAELRAVGEKARQYVMSERTSITMAAQWDKVLEKVFGQKT